MPKRSTHAGLTPGDVVQAALEVLDERGISAVSTRAVADHLGVRMNTVLWHVKTKARLFDLIADAIVGEVPLAGLEGDWHDRVCELMQRLRRSLLEHRDGALVVSGTFPVAPGTLGLADRLLSTLLDGPLDPREAARTIWALFYFTLGLVQEEQAAARGFHDELTAQVTAETYPALFHTLDDFASTDFDDRFSYGIHAMLPSRVSLELGNRPDLTTSNPADDY